MMILPRLTVRQIMLLAACIASTVGCVTGQRVLHVKIIPNTWIAGPGQVTPGQLKPAQTSAHWHVNVW